MCTRPLRSASSVRSATWCRSTGPTGCGPAIGCTVPIRCGWRSGDRSDRGVSEIEITTRDGRCRSYAYRPADRGPWPAVLVYMDGIGIRPAMLELGERLATYGWFVLLPDLFYRSGP